MLASKEAYFLEMVEKENSVISVSSTESVSDIRLS
jgi:hypothetical protein